MQNIKRIIETASVFDPTEEARTRLFRANDTIKKVLAEADRTLLPQPCYDVASWEQLRDLTRAADQFLTATAAAQLKGGAA